MPRSRHSATDDTIIGDMVVGSVLSADGNEQSRINSQHVCDKNLRQPELELAIKARGADTNDINLSRLAFDKHFIVNHRVIGSKQKQKPKTKTE